MVSARENFRLSAAIAKKVGRGSANNLRSTPASCSKLLMLERFSCRVWSVFAQVGPFCAHFRLFPAPVCFTAAPFFISLSLNQPIERDREKRPERRKAGGRAAAQVYLRNHFKCAQVGAGFFSDSRRLAQRFCEISQSDRCKIQGVRKCAVCFVPPFPVEAEKWT